MVGAGTVGAGVVGAGAAGFCWAAGTALPRRRRLRAIAIVIRVMSAAP
jgi:hypothetical protein